MEIKQEAGTIWPNEYDWQTQFAEALNDQYEFVSMDAGKVRGLALAYIELQQAAGQIAQERTDLLKTIGALIIENNELKNLNTKPVIKSGDRVKANETAGFHKGAVGTVQFVEPSGEKIWVLRDGASSPVFYGPSELDLIEELKK